MQIQYYGLSCFKIITKPAGRGADDVVLYIDPVLGNGLRSVYGSADVILSSQGDGDTGKDGFKGNPIVFAHPGEYSVRGVNIMATDDAQGHEKPSLLFVLETEDMRIAHLGRLNGELTDTAQEFIDGADILFIPVGGQGQTIDGKQAASIARNIAPKIVIPMYYDIPGLSLKLDSVKKFVSEMGADKPERTAKLILKEKDLDKRNGDVVLLESQR